MLNGRELTFIKLIMRIPFVTERIVRLAKEINAKVFIEPEYKFVGHITFKNGKTTFFKDTSFNINHYGSVQIAKDKGYSSFFLNHFGFSVPESITIFNDLLNDNIKIKRTIDNGEEFAMKIGWPVVVKPNDKSKGEGVFKVNNSFEFKFAAENILKYNYVMQIQKFCIGRDFRIVVLDGVVISAYERKPLSIKGDGKTTIIELLKNKQSAFLNEGRDTKINFDDDRIEQNLLKKGLNLNSIIENGNDLFLLDNANLSSGGSAIDFTTAIHQDFKKLAIDITKKMCLRLCGVDIITDDITLPINKYNIIEINAAPGLDHYAFIGSKQNSIVDDLYMKILLSLQND